MKKIIRVLLFVALAVAGVAQPFRPWLNAGISDPRNIGNLAAWYDISDYSSLVVDGSNRVQLVADKSGNSNENCLVLNGVAGNYASSPDSAALDITGDIDLRARASLVSWASPSTGQTLVGKNSTTGNQRAYRLAIEQNGRVSCQLSADGTLAGGGGAIFTSTVINPFSAYEIGWVRATWRQSDGRLQFFTSLDGVSWTQLGTDVSAPIASIFSSTANVEVGAHTGGTSNPTNGSIYRAQIYNGINGTLAFDANFTTAPKLATSFTESSSNAATVTVNSTGQYGARISGARDLVNMTAANQPIYSVGSDGRPLITFDGSNDSLKSGPFSLSQPEWANFVGRQITWSSGGYILDGNTANSMAIAQTTSTPRISMSAGSLVAENSNWTLNTRNLVQAVFNGASSSLKVGTTAATTGSAGTTASNAVMVGSLSGSANFGNLTLNELAVYAIAPTTAQQEAWYNYARLKWGL